MIPYIAINNLTNLCHFHIESVFSSLTLEGIMSWNLFSL